jgi:hypothetical protein
MPEGDRSGDIATVVFLVAFVVLSGLAIWDISAKHTLYATQADQAAAEHAGQAQQDIQETCTFVDLARQTECLEQIIIARHEAQRAEYNLEAQRNMADWAWYAVLISGLLLAITTTGVWLVKRTLDATHAMLREASVTTQASHVGAVATQKAAEAAIEANRVARDAFIADQRPWVSVDCSLIAPITWGENGGSFSFKFSLKNTGRTPALNTEVHLRVYSPYGETSYTEDQIKLADEIRKRKTVMGTTVFPGGTITQRLSTSIGNSEIERIRQWWREKHGLNYDWLHPVVIGCVNYRSVFGGPGHQTGFIYHIFRTVPKDDALLIAPSVGEIPLEHLALRRWMQDGRTD